MQTWFVDTPGTGRVLSRRWLLVLAGLAVQIAVVVMMVISLQQPGRPDVTLGRVSGNQSLCRVLTVTPFTDAWLHGLQPGMLVYPVGETPSLLGCNATLTSLQVQFIGERFPVPISISVPPRAVDLTNILLTGGLVAIFSIAAVAIFLRAQNRPTAHIAYALFYCISLMLCLINIQSFNFLWVSVTLLFLAMIARGLSTTFVCLFPHPAIRYGRKTGIVPYIPLGIGVLLTLLSLSLSFFVPQARLEIVFIIFFYNIACLIVVIRVLFWGLRHLTRNEQQLARMIVLGIVFLLLPLALSLNIVRTDTFVEGGIVRLLPLPLAILPIVCDYALFRHQLVGATSLFSRRVVRVLLWLLLASLFMLPSIILWHWVNSLGHLQGELRDYLYAGLLLLTLSLFPLVWNKVRDAGDQVLYRDFYQYNRSLRDLSAELTQLQDLDQICAFVLPRLATLLNATDVAFLTRTGRWGERLHYRSKSGTFEVSGAWCVYHHSRKPSTLPTERLEGVANLALTHLKPLTRPSYEPLLLDGVLLLALYDGQQLSGFLCLGPKFNLEPYSRQDGSFLTTLAAQLSVLEVNSRYLEQAQADAQQLVALNRRVISAQEDERHHIALELHDEALQQAMLLVRQLSDASTIADVAEAMPLARSVVASLRHTCLELRPPLLDELGLEQALQWLARQTEQRGALQVKLCSAISPTERLPAQVELALYRVAQEALSNVLKHARASRVIMRVHQCSRGNLSLVVWDNGRGFKREQPAIERLGLVSMHERMQTIGGRLQLRTSPGRGVLIRATYPVVPGVVEAAHSEREEILR